MDRKPCWKHLLPRSRAKWTPRPARWLRGTTHDSRNRTRRHSHDSPKKYDHRRLGADPEMRYAPSGQPVANFSVATNRKFKNAGGEDVKETVWFKVSAWARWQRHVTTTSTGQPRVCRRPPDRRPGHGRSACLEPPGWQPRRFFELLAELVRFLGGKNGDATRTG